MIDGVRTRELKKNVDDRGYLMEVLRKDWSDVFRQFGQAYVSLNYPGVIRAWHWHERQWDLFVCLWGMIKVPLYDGRVSSPTRGEIAEFVIGDHRPLAILIPPGVYHGYQTLGTVPSLLLNFPTELYDGTDERRVPHDDPSVPYHWEMAVR
ncbi:MAG: dTDP-4-dehydrorhamnose 3,5-epimerase family protein [Elusimicrobia bacterium]|nr:dTDP-4-dehydrorhamnose 3,5-epimerase family protein [Elusimicrobiota bacterium]